MGSDRHTHGDVPWVVHIGDGGGGAGDLYDTGADLTSAFGAGLLLLSLRGLSPLGRDAEHHSASLDVSPSAPLIWDENWARERTSCRTVVLKQLCTTLVAWVTLNSCVDVGNISEKRDNLGN